MGKLLKYGGLAWALLGLFGLVGLAAIVGESNASGSLDAAYGGAVVIAAVLFIFPGAKMAYRGHKLLQGDANLALRAGNLARKLERDELRNEAHPDVQAVALPRVERPCAYCAELILAAAVVCKHCGRDMPTLPRRQLGIRG